MSGELLEIGLKRVTWGLISSLEQRPALQGAVIQHSLPALAASSCLTPKLDISKLPIASTPASNSLEALPCAPFSALAPASGMT
jgi:hypothetical protein